MKNKKAAMEMSIGTIVTIVLLMTVMVLGIYLIRNISKGAQTSIDGINSAVQNEIDNIFKPEDDQTKIAIIPKTREVKIKKGESDRGFGLSIRNLNEEEMEFSYEIKAIQVSCDKTLAWADDLIFNRERTDIRIGPSDSMSNPIFVQFRIPETAPACEIIYSLEVYEGSQSGPIYESIDVYFTILGK